MHIDWIAFLTIASLHQLAVMSPGPDFAMIVKNSVLYSRRTALFTAFGIAVGIWVHVVYCILGLAVIISRSIVLFNAVKYIGAFYLFYVGIGALRARKENIQNADTGRHGGLPLRNRELGVFSAFKQGFLCNVLNPKATLFFLSLFTLVVNPETPVLIQALYGLEMFVATFIWFSFLATVITHPKIKTRMNSIQHIMTRFMGGIFILFGIKLALSRK